MRKFRTYNDIDTSGSAEVLEQVEAQHERLALRLATVRHVVAVASGKGGVGKSAVSANLAALLAARGHAVGALDADLAGPSLGRMLGVSEGRLVDTSDGVRPVVSRDGVKVVSMDMLQDADDTPLRWRGPGDHDFLWQSTLETGVLREFLSDVVWGDLDYLVVDVPPGTDKMGRLFALVPRPAVVALVTTPSEAARFVVSKAVRFAAPAAETGSAIGLVANMTEIVCADCGHATPLYAGDAVERLERDSGLPVWARVPFDPRLAQTTDHGRPWALVEPGSPAGVALGALADRIERTVAT
jgi:ATP-binding protein involved in chromosome partitioning